MARLQQYAVTWADNAPHYIGPDAPRDTKQQAARLAEPQADYNDNDGTDHENT